MTSSPSETQLKRIVEAAVAETMNGHSGLRFTVDTVIVAGHPARRILVKSTLHFNDKGATYCCGEPGCHLGVRTGPGSEAFANKIRLALNLDPAVAIEFADIAVAYHAGATFN